MHAARIYHRLTQSKWRARKAAETGAVIATFSYEPEPLAGIFSVDEGLSNAVGMVNGALLGALCWAGLLLFWLGR